MNQSPFASQQKIPSIKHIVAISSGKGGVGKSSLAFHLAHSLNERYQVGLLDADIHGPSLPRLSGTLNQKPEITDDQKLLPIVRHGLKLISMGHIVDENSALVWRGPMLFKALQQLLFDVAWGDLDFLVIDLPPGTGDIQLTLAQKVTLSGAVTISTPQNLALADVKRSVDMWKRVGVPLLGLIENMAYWQSQDHQKLELFPRGEIDSFIKENQIDLLGQFPFSTKFAQLCEAGIPVSEAYPQSEEALKLKEISEKIASHLNKISAEVSSPNYEI